MDSRIDKLVDEATIGLKDDPELRLDVRAELRAHLQETAEQHIASAETGDGIDHAIKAFGSPADIAGDLLDANKRRMKLRALVRLGVRALLAPIALLVALYTGYDNLARLQSIKITTFAGWNEPAAIHLPQPPKFVTTQTQRQLRKAEQFFSEINATKSDKLRSVWEDHRNDADSNVYFASYAIRLHTKDSRFEQEMRLGEKIDPSNAFYNYRLASMYLTRGMVAQEEEKRDPYTHMPMPDTVIDRVYMEKGIAEFLKGLAKPRCTAYHLEMVQKKLRALPQPRYIEDHVRLIAISASEVFPELSEQRHLARKIVGCTRLLIENNQPEQARLLLASGEPYTQQIASDSDTLIQLLVAFACGKMMATAAVDSYDRLGEHRMAMKAREKVELLDKFKMAIKGGASPNEKIKKNSGLLAGILIPDNSLRVNLEELAPTRNLEYTLLEQITVSILLMLFTAVLIICMISGLISFVWRWKNHEKPLFLLPSAKSLLRITAYGILLPLGIYCIYSRIPVISGREYGLGYGWPRIVAELGVLMLVLLYLPRALAGSAIRKRCITLGIPVPPQKDERRYDAVRYIITIVMLYAGALQYTNMKDDYGFLTNGDLLLLVCIGLIILLVNTVRIKSLRLYTSYFTTLSISLVPIYALAIILIAALSYPYLRYSEAHWLREDRLITLKGEGMCTNWELRNVKLLKSELLQLLDKSGSVQK